MISGRQEAERATLPTWAKPQLAALVKKAPDGSDWLHEIKLDGYRVHARLDARRVLTRRGNIWTDKYPAIAQAVAGLPAKNACLAILRITSSLRCRSCVGSRSMGLGLDIRGRYHSGRNRFVGRADHTASERGGCLHACANRRAA